MRPPPLLARLRALAPAQTGAELGSKPSLAPRRNPPATKSSVAASVADALTSSHVRPSPGDTSDVERPALALHRGEHRLLTWRINGAACIRSAETLCMSGATP